MRLRTSIAVLLSLIPLAAFAAAQDATFELHPHCIVNEAKEDDWIFGPIPSPGFVVETRDGSVRCTNFEILDPQTLKTQPLEVGDIIDIDLVIDNPSKQTISRVRAWLSYDSSMLEGQLLEINDAFSLVTPDEQDFFVEDGYAKMEASTDAEGPDDEKIVFARLQFRVLNTNAVGTPITFHDVSRDGISGIFAKEGDQESYIVGTDPGVLLVTFSGNNTVTSVTEESDPEPEPEPEPVPEPEPTPEPVDPNACIRDADCEGGLCIAGMCVSAPPTAAETQSAFSLLQIRNLRGTTDGTNVFLAWDHLRSSMLKAYNVYYGTTSGKYIQRRTINKNENSITLRSLPLNTRYFFAVRGLSTEDEESAFSQEISLVIGDPNSSTMPLSIDPTMEGPMIHPISTDQNVTLGETGAPSAVALFAIITSVIGTTFAFRRQMIAVSAGPSHE